MSTVPPTAAPSAVLPKTSVRIQSFTGSNPLSKCTTSCDLRCPHFLGATQDDHHHTIFEWDVAAGSEMVTATLAFGPELNSLIQSGESLVDIADNPLAAKIEQLVGPFGAVVSAIIEEIGHTGIRVCVLDKSAPANDICPPVG